MPNRFPGMDPFLEHPVLWPSLHQHFNALLADTLHQVLPGRYGVRLAERVLTAALETPSTADGGAGESWNNPQELLQAQSCALPAHGSERRNGRLTSNGTDAPWYIPTTPEEIRETSVEVLLAAEPEKLVTSIELITPANKRPGTRGRQFYRQRQSQLLTAGAHILEIDLLRKGQHVVLAPWERVLRRGAYHYLASLCRAGQRDFCEVWGVTLRQRLPRVALPLTEGEPDLILDLQNLLDHSYEASGLARQIDYAGDPYYPLAPADAVWAESRLAREEQHERRLA